MVRHSVPPSVKMETTFYDEQSYYNNNVNQIKRTMTLDLNATRSQMKRAKHTGMPLLSTPDLTKLISTPELEKMIAQSGTPVSHQLLFPPAQPTEEQELYAKGFVEALNELHHSDSSQGPLQPVDIHGGPPMSATYTDLDRRTYQHSFQNDNFLIKDEPQTVPSAGSSPPLSPINMESQEKIKLERKRQRNRVAASKCRRRKLERISRLEDKVKMLKGENNELSTVVVKLKQHVCMLKEKVMEHVRSGCQVAVGF